METFPVKSSPNTGPGNPVSKFIYSARLALREARLTPLQTRELEAAIKAHEDANLVENPTLQEQRLQIDQHWESINSTFATHASCCYFIRMYAQCFCAILITDYYDVHQKPQGFCAEALNSINQIFGPEGPASAEDWKSATQGDESKWLQNCEDFLSNLKEFTIERDYVHQRFRAVSLKKRLTRDLLEVESEPQLLQLIQKDLDALRHIVSFLPDLADVEGLIKQQAQDILTEMRTKKARSKRAQSSSFFTKLGHALSSVTTPRQQVSADSVSEMVALLSSDDLERKTK